MLIDTYLNRIGIKLQKPSLEFLTELQNRHLLSIPFEDLDIPSVRIDLDLNKLFKKIIINKRGGFCYELNGLFYWLLDSLGFKVDMLSAQVFNELKNQYGPDYDHMTLLVHLPNEKDYLVDVGFGDSFRVPIEFPDAKVHDISGNYCLVNNNNLFELQREVAEKWIPQYRFLTDSKVLTDFNEMCNSQQDSPDSHFRTRMLCTIATEKGRITLSNNSLTITEDGVKTKTSFDTEDEFNFYLKKYFEVVI